MSAVHSLTSQYDADAAQTLNNREKLDRNPNLLYWYQRLYREQFRQLPDPQYLNMLEIGSGASPLRRFYPNVTTSDVLQLDYLDHVFDCHEIDKIATLPEKTFDVITLTNVLHHLQRPLEFLQRAATKLRSGGKIIATEPYFSFLSSFIFRYLHHEPVDLTVTRPERTDASGPLSGANIALPWLMFVRNPEWVTPLHRHYDFAEDKCRPFSSLSYMATGGISRKIPLPQMLYRIFFYVDLFISRVFPRLTASFFTITLTRK